MGEFKSGVWIVGLILYFFTFTLIIYGIGQSVTDSGVTVNNNFGSDLNTSINTTIAPDSSSRFTLFDSISFMFGFQDDVTIGFPDSYYWIFTTIFFWIPFIMLLWSIYMALPFIN